MPFCPNKFSTDKQWRNVDTTYLHSVWSSIVISSLNTFARCSVTEKTKIRIFVSLSSMLIFSLKFYVQYR